MHIFVRPARESDAEIFTKWFVHLPSFSSEILSLPETYTLCAFGKKIIGFMVVMFGNGVQVLSRFVSDPEASDLLKANASALLLKQVITFGFINNLPEIYFMGDNAGTNRIASHIFTEVPSEEYQHIFSKSDYPVFRLKLSELICLV